MNVPKYELSDWIEMLYRRRYIAIEAAALVFGLVLLVTLLWPPSYISRAEILVQDNRAQLLVSPDLQDNSQNRAVVANPVSEQDLNSERELVTSLYLIKQAIAGLQMPKGAAGTASTVFHSISSAMDLPALGYHAIHSTPNLTPREAWALKLEGHIGSSVIKRSDVIEVSFRAHDPAWSQEFLQRLIDQYLTYHANLSNDPAAQKFFEHQADLLNQRLYASEENLRAFQIKTGIGNLAEQKQALITRLSALRTRQAQAAAAYSSGLEQIAAIQTEMKATPERIGKEVKSVQNNSLSQLKPQVMQLKAQRAELLTRYQPASERIQEIDAQLAAAQKILNHEDHLVVQEKSTDENPVWVTLAQNLDQARTNDVTAQATEAAVGHQVAEARAELDSLVNNGVSLGRLSRQVDTDKQAYLSYVRKSEEARAAAGLNMNKILNVSVAQPPELPLAPAFPKLWFNLIAGLALAAAAALGAAYWEEQRDPRLYSAAGIAHASGLATVAVLRDEG
ncbi:MAG: GumC family protein [Candidatus Binataceae bacterium]